MRIVRVGLIVMGVVAAFLAACDAKTSVTNVSTMNEMSPRLLPLFEKTKTVCFGRLLIEVPVGAQVAWGPSLTPFSVEVSVGEGASIADHVARREAELKADIRFPTNANLPMYFETVAGARPGQRTVISQREADTPHAIRLESFFVVEKDLFLFTTFADEQFRGKTIADLNAAVQRLRPNAETEIPSESGLCMEHAFLPDQAGPIAAKPEVEHIRIGFRLKEFPDVHFSIYTAPANPHASESNTLKYQLEQMEREASKAGQLAEHRRSNTSGAVRAKFTNGSMGLRRFRARPINPACIRTMTS